MRRDGGDPTTTVGLGVAQETRGMKRHDGREGSFCPLPRQRVISSQFLYRLLLLLRPLFFFSDASLPFPLPSLSLCFFHFSISSSFLFLWNLMDDDNMHFHDEKGRVEMVYSRKWWTVAISRWLQNYLSIFACSTWLFHLVFSINRILAVVFVQSYILKTSFENNELPNVVILLFLLVVSFKAYRSRKLTCPEGMWYSMLLPHSSRMGIYRRDREIFPRSTHLTLHGLNCHSN